MSQTLEENPPAQRPVFGLKGAAPCRGRDRCVAELLAAKEQAESANRAKTAFLAMISHEVRTPLNAIVGFSELIDADPTLPPTLASYIKYIHEAAVHLSNLVNRVLDISKIEAGHTEILPRRLNLSKRLRRALWMLSDQASKAGVTLGWSVEPGAETLWADEEMLTEMLLNLLSNAIRFTPGGGRVSMTATADADGGIVLAVADTGRGIPADKIDTVFEPYEQIDNHYQSGTKGGTGLGLSLVRAMIRLHGGDVAVSSRLDVGTVITLTFPPPPMSVH